MVPQIPTNHEICGKIKIFSILKGVFHIDYQWMFQLRKQTHLIQYSVNSSLIVDFGLVHYLNCKWEPTWPLLCLPHEAKASFTNNTLEHKVRFVHIPLHKVVLRIPRHAHSH